LAQPGAQPVALGPPAASLDASHLRSRPAPCARGAPPGWLQGLGSARISL